MDTLPERATALGAYFWTLRGAKSRADLALELGISEMSILRIETQGQKPKPETLKKLVAGLRARWEDIDYLADLSASQVEEGRKLANQVRDQIQGSQAGQTASDRRAALQNLANELESDPQKLDQLIDYGRYLRSLDRQREES